ncbi:MAG: bifunctional 2-polyprenyl-6-hydroxyphenol methylase/3-demethylubiquinol 3-O-methyltransferase UbiG [Alphaproteobacteria bacterium]|nr:bifunctional 2-polyprenyl-6-hydroxyphenol methylase/3-demethylubiquinol 3-O-methyltransferase UbiG [Alphaproteobacteria bacterium]
MASADPAEIEKFARLAAHWWDPAGPFAALHKMSPARLAYVREVSGRGAGLRPLAGLSALDVGCGGGLATIPLARMGADVLGVDAAPEAIAAARAQAALQGVDARFREALIEDVAQTGEIFDLVTALEIVEHVADPRVFLAMCARCVRPGGRLVVSTINRTPQARSLALFAAERILKWAPEGAHDFEKLVTPDEIRAATPELDWSAPVGLSFDLLSRDWRRSGDVSMNYMMAGAKR